MIPVVSSPAPAVIIEAESGDVRGPFVRTDRGIVYTNSAVATNGALAIYTFSIPEAGSYAIRSVIGGTGNSTNELQISMDQEGMAPGGPWRFTSKAGYQTNWVRCADTLRLQTAFHLEPGQHRLLVRCKTGNVAIDRFEMYRLPAAPGAPTPGLVKIRSEPK